MEKQTYELLDRLEYYARETYLMMNDDNDKIIIDFLNHEVFDKEGFLHHLAEDEKLQKFSEELNQELLNDEDDTDDEENLKKRHYKAEEI